MGKDKSRLKLGRKTLLTHIRERAERLQMPVRIVRRDIVPRCGPLGGVYTALKRSKADGVLFLSCDMPFVSDRLLSRIVSQIGSGRMALFTASSKSVGFPFWVRTTAIVHVEALLSRREFSLQRLAAELEAAQIPPISSDELFNINTAEDWVKAEELWHDRHVRKSLIRKWSVD